MDIIDSLKILDQEPVFKNGSGKSAIKLFRKRKWMEAFSQSDDQGDFEGLHTRMVNTGAEIKVIA